MRGVAYRPPSTPTFDKEKEVLSMCSGLNWLALPMACKLLSSWARSKMDLSWTSCSVGTTSPEGVSIAMPRFRLKRVFGWFMWWWVEVREIRYVYIYNTHYNPIDTHIQARKYACS